ncbi:MAG: biotin synthase, partial [Bacillota bacterium]
HILDWESLRRMRVVLKRAKYFITANGKFYGELKNPENIRKKLGGHDDLRLSNQSQSCIQTSLFDSVQNAKTGDF